MHAQQRGKAMFGRLRRIGRTGDTLKGPIGAASAARDGSPNDRSAQEHIAWRALGMTPADKELLAAVLAHRPAWSNALPVDVLEGSPVEAAAPRVVSPVTGASPTDFAPFGVHFPKGDPTWGHPARG